MSNLTVVTCWHEYGNMLYTIYPIVARRAWPTAECVARAKVFCIQGNIYALTENPMFNNAISMRIKFFILSYQILTYL